jgi:hypothetical protein
MLYRFQLCYAVLCGLVPACGFAVVWRSIRSLHGFGDFSPMLGRIQPLSGIKHLPAACSILSCYETYCREDRAFPRTFLATVPIIFACNYDRPTARNPLPGLIKPPRATYCSGRTAASPHFES